MRLSTLIAYLEEAFPLALQESYDNSGLQVGNKEAEVHSALITLDVTEEVLDEAIRTGTDLILSHHPLIFNGVKKITGNSFVEKCLIKAIQNNIHIYCCHTNVDNAKAGLNQILATRLGLKNARILEPSRGYLRKLVTFVPISHAPGVREAIFNAGAGHIGEYDMCSFNIEGTGTFRGSDQTNPYAGKAGEMHFEPEIRIETILPSFVQGSVITALLEAHPYEEVAFDVYPLENTFNQAGAGMIGELDKALPPLEFLVWIKKVLNCESIRYSSFKGDVIQKVAVCGGSGSFLLQNALRSGAQAFITADIKYHTFFEAGDKLLLIDAGHFETEQLVKELFYNLLIKKFPTFAVRFSEQNSNPVNYF